jgi:predicted  nucleic acid-binding Zn-ribbon protein
MKHFSSLPRLAWLLIPVLLALPACDKAGQELAAAQAAEELASLERTKSRLENELKLLRADFEKRQTEVLQRNDELLKSNDELKAQFEKAQDEAAKVKRELEEYMTKYKVSLRAKSKGLEIPRVETADNVVFESVVVREVTPKEVAISHSGGVTRIPLARLSPDLQRKFLYDPEEVKAIEAAEVAVAEAVKSLPEVAGVRMLDSTRPVNPIAVRNLTNRITSREAQIKEAEKEAGAVNMSRYRNTNIAQYRINQLAQRVAHLRNDIVALRAMLQRELNGPQSAGGPAGR